MSQTTKNYWRSFNELEDNEQYRQFVEREFPEAAHAAPGKAGRRRFMQLMGASVALASGCLPRWEREEIKPHTRRPEGLVPGVAKYFRTAMQLGASVMGLQVTSFDGRPTKIEGNPEHPATLGGTDTYAQASILGFYDPDRTKLYMQGEGAAKTASDKATFLTELRKLQAAAKASGGAKLRVLSSVSDSPTLARLRGEMKKALPRAQWLEFDPFSHDAERAGTALTFGAPHRAHHSFLEADVVVTLDADPLGHGPEAMRLAAEWGQRRRPEEPVAGAAKMLRLYAIESSTTPTGMAADHRQPLPPTQVGAFALALAQAVAKKTGKSAPAGGGSFGDPNIDKLVQATADDLVAAKGRAAVMAGFAQPADVHALAAFINDALGAVGKAVTYSKVEDERPDHYAGIAALVADMNGGKVDTLVIHGENPVYALPGDVKFGEALGKVANTIHIGLHDDETAEKCKWHVPEQHFLASWGDVLTHDGTHTLQQPLIKPLYDGISRITLAAELAGIKDPNDRLLVRETFVAKTGLSDSAEKEAPPPPPAPEAAAGGSDGAGGAGEGGGAAEAGQGGGAADAGDDAQGGGAEGGAAPTPAPEPVEEEPKKPGPEGYVALTEAERAWRNALNAGFVKETTYPHVAPTASAPKVTVAAPAAPKPGGPYEVVFIHDGKVHDGRFANNAWLQELSETRSKLTWDNAAYLSPATAAAIGAKDEDLISVQVNGQSVDLPVIVLPGQATGTIAVAIGYGRTRAGVVGGLATDDIKVGFDVNPIRSAKSPFFATGAQVSKKGGTYSLSTTIDHWAIDQSGMDEREDRSDMLVREMTLPEFEKDPDHIRHMDHHPPLKSLFDDAVYDGPRWALSIDLSRCTGCNACLVACQAENNVPVVGKDQVARGREMAWIRIDRYFRTDGPGSGDVAQYENPKIVNEPLTCMQCENAPCEQVCPVAATVHSSDGLNAMVYNRCIGTRYCANNCPYKVRRFNYHNWNEDLKDPANKVKLMVFNPEVTVRVRGVMEKCTYCTQRIYAAKHQARVEQRNLRDGDVVTACQQACPTNAIVFGNLRDETAQVTKLHAMKRTYSMLQELQVQPRTRYMARISNPNPALEPA